MTHHEHEMPDVPVELVHEHREGWHQFTRFIFFSCLAIAASLLAGLLLINI